MCVVVKSFEKLVLAHLKDITGSLLDPLQFAYIANRSVDDVVNTGLHYVLQHLDQWFSKCGMRIAILYTFLEFYFRF